MNLPAAIMLALIGAAIVFVIVVRLRARSTATLAVAVTSGPAMSGDVVRGTVTIHALRSCKVSTVSAQLGCYSTDPRDDRSGSTHTTRYRVRDEQQIDQSLAAGQSLEIPVSLPMPAPGDVHGATASQQAAMRYPVVWSLTAEASCNGYAIAGGSEVLLRD